MLIGVVAAFASLGVEFVLPNVLFFHSTNWYKEERFTSQGVGARSSMRCSSKVRCLMRFKLGYETHYDSEFYGQSYATFAPTFGFEVFSKTPLSAALLWEPGKAFHRLSDEKEFPQSGFRLEPLFNFSLRYDLESRKSINFLRKR